MEKEAFLAQIRASRAAWDSAVQAVDPSRFEEPGVSGYWTLKDVIAHVTWHDDQMIKAMGSKDYLQGSEWWMLPTDERNHHIYLENKDRTLDDVLAAAPEVYIEMMTVLAGLSQDDLDDAGRFNASPPGFAPWQIIAQNTYEHYDHHRADLERWLAR